MSEWKKVKLGEVCKIKSGKRLPKGCEFSDTPTKYKYIRARDIKNGIINGEELAYITEETQYKISKYIVNSDDIVITIVGASVGDVAYISSQYNGVNLTENAVRLTQFNTDVNSRYLFYILNSPNYYQLMQRIAGGAAQPKMGIYKVEAIEVYLPSLSTQQRIATILSRYDSLIENYQKQIKLLEESAQRLYKEWFIDLRFPGHENTQIVDGVPEGWERKILDEIADVVMGQSPKSEFYNKENKGFPFHQGVGSYGVRFVEDNIYCTSVTRVARPNSILFSVRAPVGRLNITKNKIIIGRGLAAMTHRNGCQSFLYYMLKERFFKDDIIGNGAIFASISKEELLNLDFIIPSDDFTIQFNAIARNLDDEIKTLDNQIRHLTEARDRLLPKLMSGEIEV
ncbi:MAG: restriction endonuclease subunit S [Bacteroides sp.]|nr:restriction endonuclease subunit S [Bacteroides sp.]